MQDCDNQWNCLQDGDKLKIQASLEFMLILSAVSLVAFLALGIYASRASQGEKLLNLSLADVKFNASTGSRFNISFYMPFNTVVGNSYLLNYVVMCPNGSFVFDINSSNISFSKDRISSSIENIFAGYLYFVPKDAGENNAKIYYTASCGKDYSGSYKLSTYSIYQNQNNLVNNTTDSFAIYNRNEFLLYNYSGKNNINGLSIWGHCKYYPPNVPGTSVLYECGTKNAWDYDVFSYYCYNIEEGVYYTICIVPYSTQYNLSNLNANQYSFSYNFTLRAYYNGVEFYARFNNTKCASLFSGNEKIGEACISNISGIGPINYATLISNSTSSGIANQSLYQSYMQARNNMYSTLSYFNSSYADNAEQAQINSAIDYYEKAASDLEGSGFGSIQGCYAGENYLECKPTYPLSYVINARLNQSTYNETLYYQGSILHIS